MPQLYKRYVDDTLARTPNADAAATPQSNFYDGASGGKKIPFIGIEIVKNGTKLETQDHRKPTNTIHFQSHTDKRSKDSLLKTMIHRAYALSSTTEAFNAE